MVKKVWQYGIATLLLIAIVSENVTAQAKAENKKGNKPNYKTAIGIKGFPFAADLKIFSSKKNRAVEFIGYFNDGFRLTGLYEFHGNLNGAGNLKWYLGFGAHGGYFDGEFDNQNEEGISAGLDGVVGLDYKFNRLPISLALDWQPAMEFVTPKTQFQPGFGGLAIRFAF